MNDEWNDKLIESAGRLATEISPERDLWPGVEEAISALGLSSLRMPSGAGHDAQSIALLAPIGMVFVPSVGGISHSPEEFSRPDDITNGANVLLRTLLALDGLFD